MLGRSLPLPRTFGLGVTLALPHLPAGVELVDVAIDGAELVMIGKRGSIDREISLDDMLVLLDTASGSAGTIRVSQRGRISLRR